MDSLDPTFLVIDDDGEESTDLDVVLASDLRELLDLIEGECRALRSKDSFRRDNGADGSALDSDDGKSSPFSVNIRSMKPSTIAVGSIDNDSIMICDKANTGGAEERDLSDHQLVEILEEIEDSCHKFRSAEDSSCSTTTCTSSEDGSSSQGDSLDQWSEQNCLRSPEQNCLRSIALNEDAHGNNERSSLLAAACALRAGAEAWALKGRRKYKKKKKRNRRCEAIAQAKCHRVEKLRGPRIRQCKPISPMEI